MKDRAFEVRQRAERLAAGVPPLLTASERVAVTVAPGIHGRRRAGRGETFWQFRQYQPGDPAQRIDWRRSAKSQPLYVRETEWEAAQSVWLWADGSASMDYRSHRALPSKRERAVVLALALAILLVRSGENVALLGADRAASHGPAVLDRMTFALTRARPQTGQKAADDDPGLPAFALLPRFSQLVLIGDFLAPIAAIERRLRRFAARHVTGHILQVLDPAEATLPFAGRTRFQGLENDGEVLIRRVERARGDYLARLEAQREGLRRLARATDWTVTEHTTDRPPQAALLALHASLSATVEG